MGVVRPSKCILVVLLFLTFQANGQYNVDSLKTILSKKTIHDTTKLATIALLIDNLYENKEVNYYNQLMGKIAQKNRSQSSKNQILYKKYTLYLAAYYNNISFRLDEKGDPKSLDYLNKSIQLYQSVQAYDEVYTSTVSKGLLLTRRKQYKEAVDCYFSSLKHFEKNPAENVDGISYVYSNLGVLYGEQGQWEVAIKYLKKSIVFIDKKAEKQTVEDDLQKCTMYYNIGSAYITLKNYTEATKNLNRALELSRKHNQNSYTSYSLGKLGVIDLHFKRFDEAEKKLLDANELSETDVSKGFTLGYLAEVYFQKKEFQKAKAVLDKGYVFSEISRNNDLKERYYDLMYKTNKEIGNYKESVQMLELYHSIRDSANTEEAKNELKRQQLEYDYEKKELNYKLATQKKNAAKNNILIILSSLVVLLLVGAYFLYRNYKQKQAISAFEKNELNQKLLLSQMNPHFIFNSIDNIQSLIYNKQDKEAVNYLTKFSKLTRQILENSNESFITLNEELVMIDNYLAIQQLLYNNKFDFTVAVDETLDTEQILVPPMLTQPFIENAIKHGLKNKTEKGVLHIRFSFAKEHLFFEITDNGTGFINEPHLSNNKSLAMKITKERLKTGFKRNDFEVRTENLLNDQNENVGAKVSFEIPYIYEN